LVPKHRRIGRRAATIEVGLTPSGLGDLFRDFDEIFSDYITVIADRYCQRAGDIPPMSCDRLCVGFGRYEVEVAFREGCR
jgi:hypothetical protein